MTEKVSVVREKEVTVVWGKKVTGEKQCGVFSESEYILQEKIYNAERATSKNMENSWNIFMSIISLTLTVWELHVESNSFRGLKKKIKNNG